MYLDWGLQMAGGEIQIIDDFLSKEDFNLVHDHIMSSEFAWYWNDIVYKGSKKENQITNYYTTHMLYQNVPMSTSFDFLIDKFFNKLEIKALERMKVNCYPGQDNLFEHGYHVDRNYTHKGAIFCVNTCNGYTSFKTGEKIDSIENRMILFDPSKEHSSTNTTNAKRRVNINFNYF